MQLFYLRSSETNLDCVCLFYVEMISNCFIIAKHHFSSWFMWLTGGLWLQQPITRWKMFTTVSFILCIKSVHAFFTARSSQQWLLMYWNRMECVWKKHSSLVGNTVWLLSCNLLLLRYKIIFDIDKKWQLKCCCLHLGKNLFCCPGSTVAVMHRNA